MIKVNDTKQNVNSVVIITTINCDGVHRYWTADSIEEFHKWWCDDNYGGPASDDRVVELIVDGEKYRWHNEIWGYCTQI